MILDEDLIKAFLDNIDMGVYFVDGERKILYWSNGAERITGYKSSEVVGKHCSDDILIHVDEKGNQICFIGCPLSESIVDGEPKSAEVFLHHKDGYRIPVSVNIVPLRDSGGNIVGAVEVFNDISPKRQASEKIEELEKIAYVDLLTELPNRRFMEINLAARHQEMTGYGSPYGVVMMDLDNFKNINDRYGHDVGDRVLKMVANTLKKNMRENDIVGRWGGEEFLAIIPDVKEEELISITNRFHALVEQSIMFTENGSINITISVGATMAQPHDTIESLLKRADQLMYQSKNNGRNKVSVGF